MSESAAAILQETDPDAIPADAPPTAANYRMADLAGIACQFCSKFRYTGESEDGVAQGVCDQWEAIVSGDHVSDAFADPTPPMDEKGEYTYDFSDEAKVVHEIHFAGATPFESEGLIEKAVLRTGQWSVTPSSNGIIAKPLVVQRDGESDPKNSIISLSELVENFKAGAIPNVQIPLSDDDDDHKNITKVNTGYVRDLYIKDVDGTSYLMAKMDITEPDVKEKVLRGTYSDVSCGIPFGVTSRGKRWNVALEHVAITNRPFIDGLGPFGLAASDKHKESVEVVGYDSFDGPAKQPEPEVEQEPLVQLSAQETIAAVSEALVTQLSLPPYYEVLDIDGENAIARHKLVNTTWTIPLTITSDSANPVLLAEVEQWEEQEPGEPVAQMSDPQSQRDPLEEARQLRELRLSRSTANDSGGSAMPNSGIAALDGVELSDEARQAIQSVLDENASLRARTREQEADARVEELKGLGLSERPGFLKFYRSIMLSDDGGPAVVLLSDNGTEKERLTALDVLDRAVEALKVEDKIVLSDQALASGNDNPPPANADDENKPLEERVEAAKAALGLKK